MRLRRPHCTRVPLVPRPIVLAYLALAAGVVLAWSGGLTGGPVFDDHFLVVHNPCFRTWDGIARTLSFASGEPCAYRPTRYLSYGVDVALLGDRFIAFKVGNLVRHLLVMGVAGYVATWLFAGAADRDTPSSTDRWAGLVVAALWALHPVQTDSVTYVSGRRDILVGLWILVAFATSLRALRGRSLWWAATLVATLMAFVSKESAVVIPVLVGAWALRGDRLGAALREHRRILGVLGVGLVLSAGLVVRRGLVDAFTHRGDFGWWGGSIASNFATVLALQGRYLRQVFTGGPLIGDYHAETIAIAEGFADGRALVGLALVVAMIAVVVLAWRRRPLIAFGVLWYAVALTPMSHVIPHHELYAEHYLYVPLFGLVLVVVALARDVVSAWDPARLVVAAVLGALGIAMGLGVAVRNTDWADERTFYESVIAKAPGNQRALGNLIYIYADAGEFERAVQVCGAMAGQWAPGSADEQSALVRCVDAAARDGDLVAVRALAGQLAAHHPDLGRGHRRLAEASRALQDPVTTWRAALDWHATTGSPDALQMAMEAAVVSPAISLDEVLAAGTRFGTTAGLGVGAWRARVDAIARRGMSSAAHMALVEAMDEAANTEGVPAMVCEVAARIGVLDQFAHCTPEGTEVPPSHEMPPDPPGTTDTTSTTETTDTTSTTRPIGASDTAHEVPPSSSDTAPTETSP